MASTHLEAWDIFTGLAKELWFEKPLKKISESFKTLITLVATIMTACNTLIRDNFSAVLFDEYMEKYENITVDHINAQLGNNKPLASEIPSLGTTDVMAGKTHPMEAPVQNRPPTSFGYIILQQTFPMPFWCLKMKSGWVLRKI